MKKIICISCMFLFSSCFYDPPRGSIYIRNYSDRPIYLYESWDDSLALNPGLDLFVNSMAPDTTKTFCILWRSADSIYCPSYRIDAYDFGELVVMGTFNTPQFPNGSDTLSLFFITEESMRNYSWEEICAGKCMSKKFLSPKPICKKEIGHTHIILDVFLYVARRDILLNHN